MSIERKLYDALVDLGIVEKMAETDWIKVENEPYMPLNVELLYQEGSKVVIAMGHYFEQNGDLVPDPDMEVEIDTAEKTARALHFQNQFTYQSVKEEYNPDLQRSLNLFLMDWLNILHHSGYAEKIKNASRPNLSL